MNALILSLILLSHVSPERILVRPGDSVRLTITGGKVKKILVLPGKIGYVKGNYFYATKQGEGVIKVLYRKGPPAYAFVKVLRNRGLLRVRVVPEKVQLMPGDSMKFLVKLPEGVDPERCFINWRVIPEWIGNVNLDGEFVAGNRFGKGKVIAIVKCGRRRGLGFSNVTVGEEIKFKKVSISPNPIYIPDILKGKVTLDISPEIEDFDSVDWLVEPRGLGFVNGRLQFVPAKSVGRGVLWFTGWKDGEVYTGKTFVLLGRPHSRIELPKSVVAPGESVAVRVLMRHRVGKIKGMFSWSVEPEWLGRFEDPFKFPETVFVAGEKSAVGTIFITMGRRPLDFTRTPLIVGSHEVEIEPRDTIIKVGKSIKFSKNSNFKGIWKVFPPLAGEIDQNGEFRAEVPLRRAYIIYEITEDGGGGGISTITILP